METELTLPNNRANGIFKAHQDAVYKRTDKMFAVLLPLQWLAGIIASCVLSPLTWSGNQSSVHPHVWTAIFVGGGVISLPLFLTLKHPGATLTRYVVAVSQMLMSGLLVHISGGRIETHFHIFGSLAFLSFYRDWRVLIPATLVTASDHLIRGWFYPASIYGILGGAEWRWIEHFGWILFENFFLIVSIRHSVNEMRQIATRAAELDASEQRYRAIVQQTGEGMALIELDTLAVIECNEAFRKLIGYETIAEVKKITVYDYNELERAKVKEIADLLKTEKNPVTTEQIYLRQDGSRIAVEITISLIFYDDKQVYCTVAKDITERRAAAEMLQKAHNELEFRVSERTAELININKAMQAEANERKRTEAELGEAQMFLRKVLDTVPNLIFVKDVKGNFVLVNQALANIFGTTVENLIGKTDADFSHNSEEAQRFTAQDIEQLTNLEDKFIHEEKHTDINGNVHWYQVFKRSIIAENSTKYLVGVATDLTERKILESQLHQLQKLESIGRLAAGIAHEINTPTQYVGDNARFLCDAFADVTPVLAKYKELLESARAGSISQQLIGEVAAEIQKADLDYLTEEIPAALRQSLDGVSRIAVIVQSMKDFAHPGSKDLKNADLNKAIASTVTVTSNEWKYVADLETRFDHDLPSVPCLLSEFNQVMLNMIINAAHAIADVVGDGNGGRGKITISTGKIGSDWAEIRISDTGTGIPLQAQEHIFDPFFTTKEVGRGTGQGLAISHNVIVENHKGQLSFETEAGKGTTFIIRLPLRIGKDLKSAAELMKLTA